MSHHDAVVQNGVDPPFLVHLLSQLRSHDNETRIAVENQFDGMKENEGLYLGLLQLALTPNMCEPSLRLSAIVVVKNLIRTNWNLLNEMLKKRIREIFLESLKVEDRLVSEQCNLSIAQISTFDFPEIWPDVISQLLTQLQIRIPHQRLNSAKALRMVVENSSRQSAILCFRNIMPFVLKILLFEWRLSVEELLAETSSLLPTEIETKGPSLLCLGDFNIACFRLFLSMFQAGLFEISENQSSENLASSDGSSSSSSSSSSSGGGSGSGGNLSLSNGATWQSKGKVFGAHGKAIRQWVHQILLYFPQFDSFRKKIPFLQKTYSKLMLLGIRTILAMQEKEPLAFRHHLTLSLNTLAQFLSNEERSVNGFIEFEKFCIGSLTFFHDVLNTLEYRVTSGDDSQNSQVLEAASALDTYFTPQTIQELCRLLICVYFVMTPTDLEEWENDPEQLVMTELNSWQERVRPCAEILFSTLCQKSPQCCLPVILDLLGGCLKAERNPNIPLLSILQKDAVYNALALCGLDLKDQVSFEELFEKSFALDLQFQDPRYRLIRRRIAVIIENWFCLSGIEIPKELSPVIYSTLRFLLRTEEDLVVRIWGSIALRNVVMGFDFNKEAFFPFVSEIFSYLIDLVTRLRRSFIHIQVLNVVSEIVKILGKDIQAALDSLFSLLTHLWNLNHDSEAELLRLNILRSLRRVVKAHGPGLPLPQLLRILPLIQDSLNVVTSESQEDLLEDGVRLWHSILRQTTKQSFPQELWGLLPLLQPIIDGSLFEQTLPILHVLLHYLCLGDDQGIRTHSHLILHLTWKILDEVSAPMALNAFTIFHAFTTRIVKIDPPVTVDLLRRIIDRLLGLQVSCGEEEHLKVYYLLLFGRLIALDPNFVLSQFQNEREVFGKLLHCLISFPLHGLLPQESRLMAITFFRILTFCQQHSEFEACHSQLSQFIVFCSQQGSMHSREVSPDPTLKVSLSPYGTDLTSFLQSQDPVCNLFLEQVKGISS